MDQRDWQIAHLAATALMKFGAGRRDDAIEAAAQVIDESEAAGRVLTVESWVDAQLEVVHRMEAAGIYLGRPDAASRRLAWAKRNGAQP